MVETTRRSFGNGDWRDYRSLVIVERSAEGANQFSITVYPVHLWF